MKISRAVGTVSEVLSLFIQDATVTTGAGLANIVASSVSFGWMRNDQAAVSSGTCSSGATLGTFTVSSLTQASSSLALGWYQFGVPNGVFTSGRSAFVHLYGAPSMAPLPIEIELTKLDNQTYLSSVAISTIAGGVRVSSITPPVGVSTGTVSVSTLVGVSTFAANTFVSTAVSSDAFQHTNSSTITGGVRVSSITPPVGVTTGSVNVTAFALAVGVSAFAVPVGVSSITPPVGVSSLTSSGLFNFFSVNSGNYSSAAANSVVAQIADNAGGSALSEGGISTAVWNALLSSTFAVSSAGNAVYLYVSSRAAAAGVHVTSGTWLTGTSTVTDKTGYSGSVRVTSFADNVLVSTAISSQALAGFGDWAVSSGVRVTSMADPVGVSTGSVATTSFAIAVGVSAFALPVGVSSITPPVGVSSLTSSGLFNFFSVNAGNYSSAAANSVVAQISDNAGGSALTVSSIADAVWNEQSSSHAVSGSFGQQALFPVGVSSLTSSGLFNFFSVNAGNYSSAAAQSVVKQVADNAGGSALSEGGISTAVWNALLSSSFAVSSAGNAVYLYVSSRAAASGVHISSTGIQFGVSTIVPVGVSSRVGVSSFDLPVGVSSFDIRVGVSTQVGVSSGTWLAGVSTVTDKTGYSGRVSVSTLVGVSSGTWLAGVSTVTDKTGYSGTVNVSTLVGVSSGTWLAGVSTVTDKTGYSGTVNVSAFGIPVGVSSFGIPVGVSTAVLIDSSYGAAGALGANALQMNSVPIIGTGVSSDLWRG
jgi:hypothetical protein